MRQCRRRRVVFAVPGHVPRLHDAGWRWSCCVGVVAAHAHAHRPRDPGALTHPSGRGARPQRAARVHAGVRRRHCGAGGLAGVSAASFRHRAVHGGRWARGVRGDRDRRHGLAAGAFVGVGLIGIIGRLPQQRRSTILGGLGNVGRGPSRRTFGYPWSRSAGAGGAHLPYLLLVLILIFRPGACSEHARLRPAMLRRTSYLRPGNWPLADLEPGALADRGAAGLLTSSLGQTMLSQIGIAIIACLAFNILLGQGGMLSFGHAVYSGLGRSSPSTRWNAGRPARWRCRCRLIPLVGGVAGLVFAALLGYVTTKKSGTTFAMITLGVGELVADVADVAGVLRRRGRRQRQPRGRQPLLGVSFGPQIQLYYLIALYTFVCTAAMFAFTRTPLGACSTPVRDNPSASSSSATTPRWCATWPSSPAASSPASPGAGGAELRDRHRRVVGGQRSGPTCCSPSSAARRSSSAPSSARC